jgi:hypothetical protein
MTRFMQLHEDSDILRHLVIPPYLLFCTNRTCLFAPGAGIDNTLRTHTHMP